MKCVSYTRTMPWKNHTGELTIADQNQRIAEYLAEHKEMDLQKKYSDRKGVENASAAFDKMIDDGAERKFDCIIVASMYYCGPGFPAARQSIKETLYETGVDLIVLEEGLDTRTASRKEVEDYFEEKRCEISWDLRLYEKTSVKNGMTGNWICVLVRVLMRLSWRSSQSRTHLSA